ncbi:MAG TPA: sugar ABC transporter permease [Roseiflexaceae bacterium]|nr:sugar ABC transporter permease [Roseiflexaceae bacterium]
MASIAARQARTRMGPIRRREAIAGWLFVSPWVVSLVIFAAYPVIAAIYFSFTDYNILEPPQWVGLKNYVEIFTTDQAFWISVNNTAYYALISVPLRLGLALLLALILNLRAKGIGIYRTLFYLPALVPPVVGAMIFLVLLNPTGLVNSMLQSIGLPGPRWFTDPAWSKPALIILSLWPVGVETLIFLAGLKEVPESLLDAAAIDGADPLQQFRHITLPLISPAILFNLVIGIIYSFQVFDQALVFGGYNGEPLESSLMLMVLIYRNAFRYFAMGYASALGVVLMLAVLLLTLVIFRSARIWVFYEAEDQRA